jgi:uncharacterized membrane protein
MPFVDIRLYVRECFGCTCNMIDVKMEDHRDSIQTRASTSSMMIKTVLLLFRFSTDFYRTSYFVCVSFAVCAQGIYAQIHDHVMNSNFLWVLLFAGLIAFVPIIFMIFLGYCSGLKSRTVCFVLLPVRTIVRVLKASVLTVVLHARQVVCASLLHNALGENSLILTVLAKQAGVFSCEIVAGAAVSCSSAV